MLNISLNVFWPFEILLLGILYLVLYPNFNWVGMLMSNFLSSLYILEIRPLSDVGLVIFSHSVGCLFVLMTEASQF